MEPVKASASIASFTEKDYEWLRWSLDLSIGDYRTPQESRDVLVALRAKLALVDETIPLPEQITQHIPQPKMVQQLKKKPPLVPPGCLLPAMSTQQGTGSLLCVECRQPIVWFNAGTNGPFSGWIHTDRAKFDWGHQAQPPAGGQHFISASCEGETCYCGRPATHKVGEEIAGDDPWQVRHNFTRYVCCLEFRSIFGPAVLCPTVD